MADYSELVRKVAEEYKKQVTSDKKLSEIAEAIYKGNTGATYTYATRCSEIAQNLFKKYAVTSGSDMSAVKALIRPIFQENFEAVTKAATSAVDSLNRTAGVGLKAVTPKMDSTAVKDVEDSLDTIGTVEEAVPTVSQALTDNAMKSIDKTFLENGEFQSEVGLEVTVTRIYDNVGVHTNSKPETCEWCLSRCGKNVPYNEALSMGMFQRHPGCGCTIEYSAGKKIYVQSRGQWEHNNWRSR